MELNVAITAITQEMELETGTTATYVMLRLSNGQRIRALIDDDAASTLVQLAVEQNGAPSPRIEAPARTAPRPSRVVPMPLPQEPGGEEGGVRLFGGDYDAEVGEQQEDNTQDTSTASSFLADAPAPTPAALPPAPQSRIQTLASGKIVVPSRTVSKDDAGNPVVRVQGGVDPRLESGPGVDEDGVAQA